MRALLLLLTCGIMVTAGCATPDDDAVDGASTTDSEEELPPLDPTAFAKFSAGWTVGASTPDPTGTANCDSLMARMSADGGGLNYPHFAVVGKEGNEFATTFFETASTPDVAFRACAVVDGTLVGDGEGKVPFSVTFPLAHRVQAFVYLVTPNDPGTANVALEGTLMWTPTDPRQANATAAE